MTTFEMTAIDAKTRVRWVYDGMHQTRGSYGYDTEEETKAAEDEELAKLESGAWVALGAIVQHLCEHCGAWRDGDSLWSIVIDPRADNLEEFARHSLQLSEVTS